MKDPLKQPATPRLVNKALKAAGIEAVIYRSPSGYYYWSVERNWPSIYVFNLRVFTVGEVIAEAKKNIKED